MKYYRKKIQRYCYLDETGHSGMNFFDDNQKHFILGCASSTSDLDSIIDPFAAMRIKANEPELHGNVLGPHKINLIATDLIKVIEKNNLKFVFIIVEKKYFLGLMLYHLFYDVGLNPEASAEFHGTKFLRMVISYHFIQKLTDEDITLFWGSVSRKDIGSFKTLIANLIPRFEYDEKDNESPNSLLNKALSYTLNSPEEIFCSMRFDQLASPNVQAFSMMVNTLNQHYKNLNTSIEKIVHDEQKEMGRYLKEIFQFSSRVTLDQGPHVQLSDFQEIDLIKQSELELKPSKDSNGLQLIDVALWIAARMYNERDLSGVDKRLISAIMDRSIGDSNTMKQHYDFIMKHAPKL